MGFEWDPKKAGYVVVGMSERGRLLVVSHVERGDNVRIINARKANARERKLYDRT